MLEEDNVWSKVQEEIKMESQEEGESTGLDGMINKKIQRLRWEVLFSLGTVEKQQIFETNFSSFEYRFEWGEDVLPKNINLTNWSIKFIPNS